ncbi:SGNH/GDSL hydrolase family protein [Bosea sp. (in: a-proteobacteria)]|uniref:SGNH/GDSL hydrolase family protein n=1 Tax=Bosea sp. (in: a-proteobacteria) TaxID=1871050 RepID=UPI003B3B060F
MNRFLRALLCALFLLSPLGMSVQAGPPAIPPGLPATSGQVEAVLGQIRDPIYFAKSANLRKWHSALAKLRAGIARPRVVFIGDSLTVGAGAGTSSANTWTTAAEPRSITAHFVKALAARGYPASRQSFFASSGLANQAAKLAYDPRLTFTTNWSGSAQTLGGVSWATQTAADPFKFTPEGQTDRVEVYFRQRSADASGTLTQNSDATVLATMNGSGGTEGPQKAAVSVTRGSNVYNVQKPSGSGYFILIGMITQDTTTPAVDVVNAGAFGTVSAYHAPSNPSTINASLVLPVLAPDLTVIQLGANDLNTNVDVATYTANILGIVTAAKAAGSDVVVAISSFGNSGGYGTDAQRIAYRQAVISLCAAQGCVVADYAARSISYPSANALGLMRDAIHKTEPGYADDAALLARAVVP